MQPRPEIAVTEAAVVALHTDAERVAAKYPVAETDLAAEDCVRMRRAREADPSFVAERDAEVRAIAEIPRNGLTSHLNRTATTVFFDAIQTNLEEEWRLRSGITRAQLQRL